jgi:hypothetical protein
MNKVIAVTANDDFSLLSLSFENCKRLEHYPVWVALANALAYRRRRSLGYRFSLDYFRPLLLGPLKD